MRKLKMQGFTLSQIAEETGRNFESVRRIAHKHNIIKPRSIKNRLSSHDKKEFKELYLSGQFTNTEIAKKTGISQPSVKRLAKQMNLPGKYSSDYPIRDKIRKRIAALYCEDNMGTTRIAKTLTKEFSINVSDEKVRRELIRKNIERRQPNGMTQSTIKSQNKIIKELYLAGAPLREIMKAANIGKRGIDCRLAAMGIQRSRRPYDRWGDKHDYKIKELFREGVSITNISARLGLDSPAGVIYRLKSHIFPNSAFKIQYFSKLAGKWRTSTKTFTTFQQLRAKKQRLRRYLGNDVRIIILPVKQRIKPKWKDVSDETLNIYLRTKP